MEGIRRNRNNLLLLVAGIVLGGFGIWFYISRWPAVPPRVAEATPTKVSMVTVTRDPLIATLATQVAELSDEVKALEQEPTATPVPPTPKPTATPVPPTATPTPVPPSGPYEQEGGIPYSGTVWEADVAPDEIEVLTAGPANIARVSLPGGVDRGSVIVFLPDPKKVVQYTVTGLVTGANWHGSYRPLTDPTTESTWRILANDRVAAMQKAPNCTSGLGCATVDVLVVSPEGVVAQWVVQ